MKAINILMGMAAPWRLFLAGSAMVALPVTWNYGLDDGMLVVGIIFLIAALIVGFKRALD